MLVMPMFRSGLGLVLQSCAECNLVRLGGDGSQEAQARAQAWAQVKILDREVPFHGHICNCRCISGNNRATGQSGTKVRLIVLPSKYGVM